MRNPFVFFSELMQQPIWVLIWVIFLVTVASASILFWTKPLAKATLVTLIVSVMLMLGLYSWFGYEKILGIGHIFMIPLLVYVLMEIPREKNPFKGYLIVLAISLIISLLFDIVDVWTYFNNQKYA